VLTKPFFEEWTTFLEGDSYALLENLYENTRFWESEGEEAIRTHPSFLARWNTKRKMRKGGGAAGGGMAGGVGAGAGGFAVPGAQPVTSPALAALLADPARGAWRGGAGAAAPPTLGDRELAVGVKTESAKF